ncbi:MAG: hypothetical protein ACLFUJ_00130 [Phycisphaerae bacterium]
MAQDGKGQSAGRQPGKLGWWIAASASAGAVVAGAAVLAWWIFAGTVWTDGAGLRRDGDATQPRQVLWDQPESIQGLVRSEAQEYEPALSADGKELYFVRGLPGRYGPERTGANAELFVAYKTDTGWSEPAPLEAVNTEYNELGPRLTPDGKWLLLYSDRPGGQGQYDIWASRRTDEGWAEPVNLGPAINSPYNDYSPAPAPDGRLFFATNRLAAQRRENDWKATVRQGDLGDYDLFVAWPKAPAEQADQQQQDATEPQPADGLAYHPAETLLGANTKWNEGACAVSPAGDFLYFASNRPRGHGGFDLYRLRLRGKSEGPVNLGPEINSAYNETDPELTDEGFTLVFSSDRAGREGLYSLYQAISREVYPEQTSRSLPGHWSWWMLAGALALLVPAMLFLKAVGYDHLSALQKAIAASVLLHILLTVLLGLVFVSQEAYEYVAEKAGLIESVSLELAPEAQAKMEIRESVSQLPVQDPRQVDVARAETVPAPRVRPAPAELNEPSVPPAETQKTQQPTAPQPIPPVAAEQIRLPDPPEQQPQPRFEPEPAKRVAADEARPEVHPEQSVEIARVENVVEPVRVRAETQPAEPAPASDAPMFAEAPLPSQQDLTVPVEAQPEPAEVLAGPEVVPAAPAETSDKLAADAAPQVRQASDEVQVARARPSADATHRPEIDVATVPVVEPTDDIGPTEIAYAPAVDPVDPAEQIQVNLPQAAQDPRLQPVIQPSREKIAHEEHPLTAADAVDVEKIQPGPLSQTRADEAPAKRTRLIESLDAPAADSIAEQLLAETPAQRPAEDIGEMLKPVPEELAMVGTLDPGRLTSPLSIRRRSFPQRQEMIRKMGGSEESEAAVAKALAWMAREQEKDGRWTYKKDNHHGRPDMALTGLAALSYLAADHRPGQESLYRKTVTQAVDYLVENQKQDGDLRGGGNMYAHGIATIALSEAAAMSGEPKYRDAAIRAAKFIIRAQNPQTGGWRYKPYWEDKDKGDMSVVGWQVMALHSVSRLGLQIPDETRKRTLAYIHGVTNRDGLAGYTDKRKVSPAMTAEAIFSRILMGETPSDSEIRKAGDLILKHVPSRRNRERNFYSWYYCSLALMQVQGPQWDRWNKVMRDYLVKLQENRGGEAGSFDPDSRWGRVGGRTYTTATATLTLQVYYRYPPYLQEKDD